MGRSFLRFALIAFALAAAAHPALASSWGGPQDARVSWDFDSAIQVRHWQFSSTSTCTAWDNSTGVPGINCSTWSNQSSWGWKCGPERTYSLQPVGLAAAVMSRALSGTPLSYNFAGSFAVLDAGLKALGGASSFNNAYCFNGGNATGADLLSIGAELLGVPSNATGLTPKTAYGGNYAFTGSTPNGSYAFKFGGYSVPVSVSGVTQWNTGTFDNASTDASGNLQLDFTNPSTAPNRWVDPNLYLTNSTPNFWINWTNQGGGATNESRGGWILQGSSAVAASSNYTYDYSIRASALPPPTFTHQAFFGLGRNAGWDAGTGFQGIFATVKSTGVQLQVDNNGAYPACSGPDLALGTTYYVRQRRTLLVNSSNLVWIDFFTSAASRDASTLGGDGNYATCTASGVNTSAFGSVYGSNICNYAGCSTVNAPGWSGGTANHTLNSSRLWGSTTYNQSGYWNSSVMQAGSGESNFYKWLNATVTNASSNTGTSWNLSIRTSNTTFGVNATSPVWLPLTNATGGVSALDYPLDPNGNVSQFAQIRIGLSATSSSTTPSISQLVTRYTRVPVFNAAMASNLSYVAPGQPVNVSLSYNDTENGIVRMSLYNSTGGAAPFCDNRTMATGNSSLGVMCSFAQNNSTDGERPSFIGNLTDDDGAYNTTNATRPFTVDNAAPDVSTATTIVNTSTMNFVLNFGPLDNVSGVNRSWFAIYNLSNSSDGSSCVTGLCNTTHSSNGSYSICEGCGGQYRFSGQADDNVAVPYKHISALTNSTFWYDPPPLVTTATITDPAGAAATDATLSTTQVGTFSFRVTAAENLTRINNSTVAITGPNNFVSTATLALDSGSAAGVGVWKASLALNTQGSFTANYTFSDTSTTRLGWKTQAILISSVPAASGGQPALPAGGPPGGGGPGAPQVAPIGAGGVPGGALAVACPPEVQGAASVWPWDASNATWTYFCATGDPVSSCSADSGAFSCEPAAGGAVFRRPLTLSSVPPTLINWKDETYIRLVGANGTATVKVGVSWYNFGAYLPIDLGPLSPFLSKLTPFSIFSVAGAVLAFVGAALSASRVNRWALRLSGVFLVVWGVERVLATPSGPVTVGVYLGWPLFLMIWSGSRAVEYLYLIRSAARVRAAARALARG